MTLNNDCSRFDARKIIGEKHSESKSSITNYIRLSYLIPKLLMFVDEKKLQLTVGVELSHIDEENQSLLFNKYIANGIKLTKEQLWTLKQLSANDELNEYNMAEILESE